MCAGEAHVIGNITIIADNHPDTAGIGHILLHFKSQNFKVSHKGLDIVAGVVHLVGVALDRAVDGEILPWCLSAWDSVKHVDCVFASSKRGGTTKYLLVAGVGVTVVIIADQEVVGCTCTHIVENNTHTDITIVTSVDDSGRGLYIGDGGHTVDVLGEGVVIGVDILVVGAPGDEPHSTHGGTLAMAEGVVEEFCGGEVVAEVVGEVDMLSHRVVVVVEVVDIAVGNLVLSEVTQTERDIEAVASHRAVERRGDGIEVEVVGQWHQSE